jgi:hypothetical protein
LLILPGAIISILNLFTKKQETDDDWKKNGTSKVLYRVIGVLVFVALTLNAMKFDIFTQFFELFK